MAQLGKNYGYINVDMRLATVVPFGEVRNLELMAELFNLFNLILTRPAER